MCTRTDETWKAQNAISLEEICVQIANNQAIWWQKHQPKLYDFKNLSIFSLDYAATQALADLADRNIKLTITIQDGEVWVSSDTANIEIKPQQLM